MKVEHREELANLRRLKGSTLAPGSQPFTIQHPRQQAVIQTNSRQVTTDGAASATSFLAPFQCCQQTSDSVMFMNNGQSGNFRSVLPGALCHLQVQ
eukprot:SAG31_NODE_442_length_15661_cov_4.132245_8_plen_96_part_00